MTLIESLQPLVKACLMQLQKVLLLISAMSFSMVASAAPSTSADMAPADSSSSIVAPNVNSAAMQSDAQINPDDVLAHKVGDAIASIVANGAAQVNIAARAGHITLTGIVASAQVKKSLLQAAKAVDGVKGVKSELKLAAG